MKNEKGSEEVSFWYVSRFVGVRSMRKEEGSEHWGLGEKCLDFQNFLVGV